MPQDVKATLAERGNRYGSFIEYTKISQDLKKVMAETDHWDRLPSYMKESLTMIQHKIARILNGDPSYPDSWHDIGGYSKLVEDELIKQEEQNETDDDNAK